MSINLHHLAPPLHHLETTGGALTPCAPHTTPLYGVWGVVCAVSVVGGVAKVLHHQTHHLGKGAIQ